MRKQIIWIILIGVLIAFVPAQIGSVNKQGDLSVQDVSYWKVTKSTDKDFDVYIQDIYSPKTEICLLSKTAKTIDGVGLNIDLYNNNEEKITTLTKQQKDTKYGYCYTINNEKYVKFGSKSTIIEYQELSTVNYNYGNLNVNATLERCDSNRENCGLGYPNVIIVNSSTLKFGAEDNGTSEDTNYRYIFNSTKPIKQYTAGFYYIETGNTQEGGISQIGKTTKEIVKINTQDICYDLYEGESLIFNSNCEFNLISPTELEILFTGRYNQAEGKIFIDPHYQGLEISNFDEDTMTLDNVTIEGNYSHLNITTQTPYNNLSLYYSFDGDAQDTTAFTAYDFSGNNNDGTGNGGAVAQDNLTNGIGCIYDNCLYVTEDGGIDYIEVPNSASLDFDTSDAFTISMWVKTTGDTGAQGGTGRRFVRQIDTAYDIWYSGTTIYFRTYDTSNTKTESTTSGLTTDVWHHIVMAYNGSNQSLYLDNVLKDSDASSFGLKAMSNGVRIGAYSSGGGNMNGTIDEVMFFNSSLTASEISEIYNNQSNRFFRNGTQGNMTFNATLNNSFIVISEDKLESKNSFLEKRIGEWNTTSSSYDFSSWQTSDIFKVNQSTINFTLEYRFNAGDYNFTSPLLKVSSGVPLTFQASPNVTDCGYLGTSGGNFTLNNSITLDSDITDKCIVILADNITLDLSGYTISGEDGSEVDTFGVYIEGYNQTRIKNGKINDFETGIEATNSHNNNFTNLTITGNMNLAPDSASGIMLDTSNNNTISLTNITLINTDSGAINGIYGTSSSNNTINNNTIDYNSGVGNVYAYSFTSSSDNLVKNNTARHNGGTAYGFYFDTSNYNNILDNNATNNSFTSLYFISSYSNISNNTGYSSGVGLYLRGENNTLEGNNLWNCTDATVGCLALYEADNNTISGGMVNLSATSLIYLDDIGTDGSNDNLFKNINLTGAGTTDIHLEANSNNNTFLNMTYSSELVKSGNQLIRKWYYSAYANDSISITPLQDINITAFNTTGEYQINLTTDSTGFTPLTDYSSLTEYTNISGTATYYSNYTIYASNDSYPLHNHSYNVSLEKSNYEDIFNMVFATINFTDPTKPDGYTSPYRDVDINGTISGNDIKQVKLGINGTNYTTYNKWLVLSLNFNNLSSLGEDATHAVGSGVYARNATSQNGASLTESGKYGTAYSFDGVNDYVVTDSANILDSIDDFSVSAWFKVLGETTDPSGYATVVAKSNGANNRHFLIYYDYGQQKIAVTANKTFLSSPADEGEWNHLVLVYNYSGSQADLYLNGNLVSSDTTIGLTSGEGVTVKIGTDTATTRRFNGTIDDVLIWNTTLTRDEAEHVYKSTVYKYDANNIIFLSNVTLNLADSIDYFAGASNSQGSEVVTETRSITIIPCPSQMSGNGEYSDECLVADCIDLQAMEEQLNLSYKLNNDIDCSGTYNWNSGSGFDPVGTDTTPFYGNLSGGQHIVEDIFINRSTESYNGVIGFIGNGTSVLEDIGIVNCTVYGTGYSGCLFGDFRGSKVVNSYVNESFVQAVTHAGLLGGITRGGYMNNTYAIGELEGVVYGGGLVGVNKWKAIDDSVTSYNNTIENSYSVVNITQLNQVFGVYGRFGGLVGVNYQYINNSFSISNISCYDCTHSGWFIGENYHAPESYTENNYFYNRSTDFPGINSNPGNAVGVYGADYLKNDVNGILPFSKWDFFDTWEELPDDSPVLTWQGIGTTITDTSAPNITLVSPTITDEQSPPLNFNILLDEDGDECKYSIDGASNVTLLTTDSRTYTATQSTISSTGAHNLIVYCNDTNSNNNQKTYTLTIASVPKTGGSPQYVPIKLQNINITTDENWIFNVNNEVHVTTLDENKNLTAVDSFNITLNLNNYTSSLFEIEKGSYGGFFNVSRQDINYVTIVATARQNGKSVAVTKQVTISEPTKLQRLKIGVDSLSLKWSDIQKTIWEFITKYWFFIIPFLVLLILSIMLVLFRRKPALHNN